MNTDINLLIRQIKSDLCNAEELVKKGNLEQAFVLSEKIAETFDNIKVIGEHNLILENLKKKLVLFRRDLNNRMVKVVRSSFTDNSLNPSSN